MSFKNWWKSRPLWLRLGLILAAISVLMMIMFYAFFYSKGGGGTIFSDDEQLFAILAISQPIMGVLWVLVLKITMLIKNYGLSIPLFIFSSIIASFIVGAGLAKSYEQSKTVCIIGCVFLLILNFICFITLLAGMMSY